MSLKIFFGGSIRGGRDDALIYANLIEQLKDYGHVLTEHVGSIDVLEKENNRLRKVGAAKSIHDQDMEWVIQSDVIVAEVTQPSLGVGYELGRAIEIGKPVLCLFRPASGKKLSCMIQGAHNGDSFIVKHYEEADAADIFKEYFAKFQKKV